MNNNSENKLIGVNFGSFLPKKIISGIYTVYDRLQSLVDQVPLDQVVPADIESINSELDEITIKYLEGGKDTLFLVKVQIQDYKFIYKLYNLKPYEVFTYLLSINEFVENIPDRITLQEGDQTATVHIVPLHVYATGKITSQQNSSYVVIQEYSDKMAYTEFIKEYKIPFNIVKRVWKYIHQNGFVIDFLPSNFKISFNQEHQLYWLEYMDYIFFNDPNLRSQAIVVEQNIDNDLSNHPLFQYLERTVE